MARETNRVVENRNLELIGNTAGTFSNTGGYMGVDGINNLVQEKNYPSYIDNLRRMAQQQNQLGLDEFGSYVIPTSDPTYSTGQQYARSIAGGIPMSQVIAPGVSYSPEQPMGYTQEQLNIARDVDIPPPPPAIMPPTREPDDPSFLGTGIGGVTIPGGRRDKMPPLRNIFGDMQPPVQVPPKEFNIGNLDIEKIRQDIADSGIDFTNLFGLPQAPDLSQFVTKQDIPTYIPEVPTGRDFSIDREALRKELMEDMRGSINIPDISGLARLEDIPSFDPSVLKQDILMSIPQQQVPDVSKFVTQDDISKAIAGIDMPTLQQPDLSVYDTRLAQLEEQLAGFKQPTGGRFSVDQQLPMGLF